MISDFWWLEKNLLLWNAQLFVVDVLWMFFCSSVSETSVETWLGGKVGIWLARVTWVHLVIWWKLSEICWYKWLEQVRKYDCIQNGGLINVDLYTLVQSDKANLKQIQVDWLLMRHEMTWNQRTLALNIIFLPPQPFKKELQTTGKLQSTRFWREISHLAIWHRELD